MGAYIVFVLPAMGLSITSKIFGKKNLPELGYVLYSTSNLKLFLVHLILACDLENVTC